MKIMGRISFIACSFIFSILAGFSVAALPTGGQGVATPPWANQTILALCCGAFILLVILVFIIWYLFFRKKPEVEKYAEYGSGSESASMDILGPRQPCKYCGKIISPNSNLCQFCGKVSPLGPLRCPKCRNPVAQTAATCGGCGLAMKIFCIFCGKKTSFGDYCDKCKQRLLVVCPECQREQPPIGERCIKCGKKFPTFLCTKCDKQQPLYRDYCIKCGKNQKK